MRSLGLNKAMSMAHYVPACKEAHLLSLMLLQIVLNHKELHILHSALTLKLLPGMLGLPLAVLLE